MNKHSTAQRHDLQSTPSLAVTRWSWRVRPEYFPPTPVGKLTIPHSITTCTSAFDIHSCAIQWRRASSRCASDIELLRKRSRPTSQAAYCPRWHTCTIIRLKATSSKGDCFSLIWWIQFVNFTGSISLGKQLASLCGQYLKYVILEINSRVLVWTLTIMRWRPSVMELGGKAPAIVLPSADLQLAANHVSSFPQLHYISAMLFGVEKWGFCRFYLGHFLTRGKSACQRKELSSMRKLPKNLSKSSDQRPSRQAGLGAWNWLDREQEKERKVWLTKL